MTPRLAPLLLLAACTGAHASTSEAADTFVSRSRTDAPLERYEQGDLGVVLPSYGRVYLYPAWRAIVLGREGLAANPVRAGGLKEAAGDVVGGWTSLNKDNFGAWRRASQPHAQRPPPPDPAPYRSQWRGPYSYTYLNCPDTAFEFAIANLAALEKRPDAQPQRLREWIAAQDAVFDFCDFNPQQQQQPIPALLARPRPVMPVPLAATEPLYWRQLRDYQIASAHFYDEKFAEATRQFEQIAATPAHPMQGWGAYLALRSQMRAASMDTAAANTPQRKLAALLARGESILGDARLAHVHEPVRATLRAARFRFAPQERLETLARWLDDPARDPHRESALGDWRRLAADAIEQGGLDRRLDEVPLRRAHRWFDWMRTLQRCAYGHGVTSPEEACPAERAHALERWQGTSGGERRAWLVAALTLADKLSPALETAAAQVPAHAPEAVSVRLQLARLYRVGEEPAKARAVAGAALDSAELARTRSDSARFLLEQERFASASSRDDAVGFLQRKPLWHRDEDTGEVVAVKDGSTRLAADGLAWLNSKMSIADLLDIGGDARLDERVRAGIVTAAWLRADLLGNAALAARAAEVAQSFRGLRDASTRYLGASANERRHVLLLAALRLQLSPDVPSTTDFHQVRAPARTDGDQPTASMWCRIGAATDAVTDPWNTRVENVPATPDLAPDPQARDLEIAALRKLRTATGFAGEHALARARTHPDDPDLPWLLHVVVQSTKGGCVDDDNRQLSRAAFQLLHTRYRSSPWARRTPYWY